MQNARSTSFILFVSGIFEAHHLKHYIDIFVFFHNLINNELTSASLVEADVILSVVVNEYVAALGFKSATLRHHLATLSPSLWPCETQTERYRGYMLFPILSQADIVMCSAGYVSP